LVGVLVGWLSIIARLSGGTSIQSGTWNLQLSAGQAASNTVTIAIH